MAGLHVISTILSFVIAAFMTHLNTRQQVFQTHRKTVLGHLGWVYLPSIDLAVKTALHCVNGEGIPNDIMLEAFGSMAMFATNMKATIEDLH